MIKMVLRAWFQWWLDPWWDGSLASTSWTCRLLCDCSTKVDKYWQYVWKGLDRDDDDDEDDDDERATVMLSCEEGEAGTGAIDKRQSLR